MEVFLVYLWLQLDSLVWAAIWATILSVAFMLVCLLPIDMCTNSFGEYTKRGEEDEKIWKKRQLRAFFLAIVFAVVATILPTSKTVAYMVGAHYATKLATSPEASKVMSLVRKQANDILDKELAKK